jgi:hypothetical protein
MMDEFLLTSLPGYLQQARRGVGGRGRSPAHMASIRARGNGRLKEQIRFAFEVDYHSRIA